MLELDDLDEQVGANIVLRSLEELLRWIVGKAGMEGSTVVVKVPVSRQKNYGHNTQTGGWIWLPPASSAPQR